jgi:hypothetical protein
VQWSGECCAEGLSSRRRVFGTRRGSAGRHGGRRRSGRGGIVTWSRDQSGTVAPSKVVRAVRLAKARDLAASPGAVFRPDGDSSLLLAQLDTQSLGSRQTWHSGVLVLTRSARVPLDGTLGLETRGPLPDPGHHCRFYLPATYTATFC